MLEALPTPPPALILIGVIAVLDVISTTRALRKPDTEETNGWIAWLMSLGAVWIAFKLAASGFGIWLMRDQTDPLNIWSAGAAFGAYGVIVWQNWRLGS